MIFWNSIFNLSYSMFLDLFV